MTASRNCDFIQDAKVSRCQCCGREVQAKVYPIYASCRAPCLKGAGKDDEASNPSGLPRPGAVLKHLLKSWLGVSASPNCSCNAHAKKMDEMEAAEPGWCMRNIDEIVGWLEQEARKRRLPFVKYAAKLLVKRAIRLSYKEARK